LALENKPTIGGGAPRAATQFLGFGLY
jgi:hypothetical protein